MGHNHRRHARRALHLVVALVAEREEADNHPVLAHDVLPLDDEAFVEEALGEDNHCMFIQDCAAPFGPSNAGTPFAEAASNRAPNGGKIPKSSPPSRADAHFLPKIVIPVVVGSSPISHPIKTSHGMP
ncbi:MAG TPA: hypothetical protein VGF12_18390 [Roseateles sp.]